MAIDFLTILSHYLAGLNFNLGLVITMVVTVYNVDMECRIFIPLDVYILPFWSVLHTNYMHSNMNNKYIFAENFNIDPNKP